MLGATGIWSKKLAVTKGCTVCARLHEVASRSHLLPLNSCPIRARDQGNRFTSLGHERDTNHGATSGSPTGTDESGHPCRRARPGVTPRHDTSGTERTPGLGVVIQPNGNRAFIVQRGIGRKTVRRALGTFPEMTLAEARRLAGAPAAQPSALGAILTRSAGTNARRPTRAKGAGGCAVLWARYETEVIAVRNRASTAGEKDRMWLTKIKPVIGKVAVRDVDADHIRPDSARSSFGRTRMVVSSAGRARPATCTAYSST